jgi:hypothetical protein
MVSRHDTRIEPSIVVGWHEVLRLGFRCSSEGSGVVVGRKCQGSKGKRIRGVDGGQGHHDYGLVSNDYLQRAGGGGSVPCRAAMVNDDTVEQLSRRGRGRKEEIRGGCRSGPATPPSLGDAHLGEQPQTSVGQKGATTRRWRLLGWQQRSAVDGQRSG